MTRTGEFLATVAAILGAVAFVVFVAVWTASNPAYFGPVVIGTIVMLGLVWWLSSDDED